DLLRRHPETRDTAETGRDGALAQKIVIAHPTRFSVLEDEMQDGAVIARLLGGAVDGEIAVGAHDAAFDRFRNRPRAGIDAARRLDAKALSDLAAGIIEAGILPRGHAAREQRRQRKRERQGGDVASRPNSGPSVRGRHHTFTGARAGRPRMMSAIFSAIMITVALILAPTRSGMTAASTTRKPSIPRTLHSGSTTAIGSASTPILQLPSGWCAVAPTLRTCASISASLSLPGPGASSAAAKSCTGFCRQISRTMRTPSRISLISASVPRKFWWMRSFALGSVEASFTAPRLVGRKSTARGPKLSLAGCCRSGQ